MISTYHYYPCYYSAISISSQRQGHQPVDHLSGQPEGLGRRLAGRLTVLGQVVRGQKCLCMFFIVFLDVYVFLYV
jgi:hypothetical protein